MPTDTPSTLSRDKSGLAQDKYGPPPPPSLHDPFTSILGKRFSMESSPGTTKRHATMASFHSKEESEMQYDEQHLAQSPSQSSIASDEDFVGHGFATGHIEGQPLNGLLVEPSLTPQPTDYARVPRQAIGGHIFQTNHVRSRRSAPTITCISKWAKENPAAPHTDSPEFHSSYAQGIPIIYWVQCPERHNSHFHKTLLYEDDPIAAHLQVTQISSHLAGNLRNVIQKAATFSLDQFITNGALEIRAPYQALYFDREALLESSESISALLKREIEALVGYVVSQYGQEYREAERLLSEHRTKVRHLDKIFKPNQLAVDCSCDNNRPKAKEKVFQKLSVISSWPTWTGPSSIRFQTWNWHPEASSYHRQVHDRYIFGLDGVGEDSFPINNLNVVPLSVLNDEDTERLRERGKKSWQFRHPKFVCHLGNSIVKPGRYMVDHDMYRRLHKKTATFSPYLPKFDERAELWRPHLLLDDVPNDNEYLIMPDEVPGYDFHEKEWRSLAVAEIEQILWSTLPFEHLVLPRETKRLVRALVTFRASSIKKKRQEDFRANFDIIPGKGNGLIMLFHGSPGTGKTLTAESVAEIAEMPLYPITCGDIGTEPDKVEQYLQLVFELGMRWNCVLLLDEADVFLEERTLTDLQRNSLVSVFLRMLEYYEGILILTSNRVGTFDEAFRSRIHIALHYEDLKPSARRQIWQKFLERLENTDEGENLDGVKGRLDELAHHKLNGREIRNALSTARQLASHENQKVGWDHLQLAIRTIDNFGVYLKDVHGHSDRDWAKERRER